LEILAKRPRLELRQKRTPFLRFRLCRYAKSSELRQASATRPQQADDSDEDDRDDSDDANENDTDNDNDNDTRSSSADLLSRARHIVGRYIDNAETGIVLSDSTRAGLQLLSTRSSYVLCHGVVLMCVAWPSCARSF
jgi:hypothetical protein